MSHIISDQVIEYVGTLAKLDLSEYEKEQAKKEMSNILDYIDILNELDTTEVEPMSQLFDLDNVFREDVADENDNSKQTIKNAPEEQNGYFVVPAVF